LEINKEKTKQNKEEFFMNMKKTIAGVMAGAMAVSAMAATVSADQDSISLTYDLKTYKETSSNGTVVVVEQYTASTESTSYIVKDVDAGLQFGASQAYLYDLKSAEVTVSGIASTDGSAAKTISNTVKYTNDTSVAAKDATYIYNSSVISNGVFTLPLSTSNEIGKLNIKAYDLSTLGYSYDEGEAYGFNSVTAKLTYEVPATITVDGSNSWSGFSAVYEALGISADTTVDLDLSYVNSGIATLDSGLVNAAGSDVKPSSIGATTLVAGSVDEAIYPLKSGLNNPADVVAALQTRKAGDNYYTRPVAVINDAIANAENVTFTFTSYDGYVATTKSHLYKEWVEADRAYGWQTSTYDWYNPTFSQHLYTNVSDSYSAYGSDVYDMYGSYSSAWGVNLFTGAIVVNSGLTMQLSDTDKFNWGSNTLTFDWFSITDEGKITDAKTFLTSMLLYTPTDWYWDNLTVVVGDADEDNVDAGEGLDGEGDEIEDEEIDEIVDAIVDEVVDEVTEEPAEEVVEEPAEEVAPAAPVASPSTGNAPVALAVIPVALAAAAVVAKKRG
jgi:hypothetical protein